MKKCALNTVAVIFSILGFASLLMPMYGTQTEITDGISTISGANLFNLTALSDNALSTVIMIIGIIALVASAVLIVTSILGNNKSIAMVKNICAIALVILGIVLLILSIVYVGQLNEEALILKNNVILMGAITLFVSNIIAGLSALLSKYLK